MLSYIVFFFFIFGLASAVAALLLDRGAPLNRAMAAATTLYALWSFCFIFVYASNQPTTVMAFYKLSFVGAYFLSPALIWLYLVLAGTSLRFRLWIVVPLVAFTAFGYGEGLHTNFRLVAFTAGPFGNVGVLAGSDFWGTLVFYVSGAVELFGVAALLRARARESSLRVRKLLAIIVVTFFASLVLFGAAVAAQLAFSLPPLTVLAAGPALFVNSFLIVSHRYLRRRDPTSESVLGSAIPLSMLFLDENRTIISMSAAAAQQFEGVQAPIVGSDLASLLDDPQMMKGEWELARQRRPAHSGVPCQIGGRSVIIRLTPHYDRFRDLTGAVAVLENVSQLDETAARYGLSPREKEIIAMLRHGYRNREIADRLFVTVGTVKNHFVHIFQKTGVSNRVRLSTLFYGQDQD